MKKILALLALCAFVVLVSNGSNLSNVVADLDPKPHGVISNPRN